MVVLLKKYHRLLVVIAGLLFFYQSGLAQWRLSTPKDQVYVPASSGIYTQSTLSQNPGVVMLIEVRGTFSLFSQQKDSSGIDGAFTYKVPGWNIFTPLANPPTYNNIKFDWYLGVAPTLGGGQEKPFAPIENYQLSHVYTSRVTSTGNRFNFLIHTPSGSYRSVSSGGVTIKLTRWTAGMSVKTNTVDFKNVPVGQQVSILDSIASYGIDPLRVDSIKIINASPAGNSDFSVQSQRNAPFSLANEAANEIKFSVIPSVEGTIKAQCLIYCHNVDPSQLIDTVNLSCFGTAPKLGLLTDTLNFGKVLINDFVPAIKSAYIGNPGNTDLHINSNTKYVQISGNAFSYAQPPVFPITVKKGDVAGIKTLFKPTARQQYSGWLKIYGDQVPPDSVYLMGEGIEAIPALSDTLLDFGNVYNGSNRTLQLRIHNTGNTQAKITSIQIGPASYTINPNSSEITIDPDSTEVFDVTFTPATGQVNFKHFGELTISFSDNTVYIVHLIGVEIQPPVIASVKLHDFGYVKATTDPTVSKTEEITKLTSRSATQVALTESISGGYYSIPTATNGLSAGQIVPIKVKFKPILPGAWQGYYYFEASGSRDSVELRGIGFVAKGVFDPNPVNFGIVPSNFDSMLDVRFTDSGNYPLKIVRFEISGPNASEFRVVSPVASAFPISVSENSTIALKIGFKTNAKTGEAHQATLCAIYDDSSSDCVPLEAIEEAQFLQFGQSSIDFGKVRVATTKTLSAVFRNGSNKTLTVDTLSITPQPSVYSLGAKSKTVIANSKDSVDITFAPDVRGGFTSYLHGVGGDFRNDSIQIRGIGVAPQPVFSPDTVLNFGNVALLATSAPKTLRLSNTGDWMLGIVNISIVGKNADEFSGTGLTPDTLGEGLYRDYDITFTPKTTIVYHTATLLFTYDDGSQSKVTLIGYDESSHLVLTLDTLDFGKVRLGATPPVKTVQLINTYFDSLTAKNVYLTGAPEYTAAPLGVLGVPAKTQKDISVTFTPSAVGPFSAMLISDGGTESIQDTTFITGIGAKPAAKFSDLNNVTAFDTLDFGSLFVGYTAARTINLTNIGNWEFVSKKASIGGNNQADFTAPSIAQNFTVRALDTQVIAVNFAATTGYQAAPRIAELDFTLDDGSIVPLYLKEQDLPPIPIDVQFDNSAIRLTDVAYPNLRLITPIPDSLNVNHIQGVIEWDPAVVNLEEVKQSDQLKAGAWTLTTTNTGTPGKYSYDLTSTTDHLNSPGALLRLKFSPAKTAKAGDVSTLKHSIFNFPTRTEFTLQERQGTIVIDSACGNTHMTTGTASASYIEMNSPNPFGGDAASGSTNITFAIASQMPVTIRVLDITGKEVLRPVNNEVFVQGYYELKLSANDLPGSGTYFYEFTPGNEKPTVRKMIVNR